MQLRTPILSLAAAVVLGCPAAEQGPAAEASDTTTAGSTSAPAPESSDTHTEDGSATTSDTGTPPVTTDDGPAPTSSTGEDPTGAQCQADEQDCPSGFKCVLRRDAEAWEFVCLPVNGDGEPGDPCVHDGVVSGTDSCNEDTWCIGSFDASGRPWDGVCYPLCVEDTCEAASDVCVGIGMLPVCAAACDPLLPGSCGAAESCILRGYEEGFVCFPSGAAQHELGEVCETAIDCAAGLHCSQNVVGCAAEEYCCTDPCDTQEPESTCAEQEAGAQCVAIGVATPGQEHVGACVVP